MSTYIYACPSDPSHPRKEARCRMTKVDELVVVCNECGAEMHRVPQPFQFGGNFRESMLKWGRKNFELYRAGKPRIPYPE